MWTSILSSFLFSSFFPLFFSPVSPTSFATTLRRCPDDRSDYPDASSTRRGLWMGCCSAVSTGSQHSLTTEQPPRDCGLSHTPSLPDRSTPSIDPPCVPSRLRYGHTDLVQAAKQIRIPCNSLNKRKTNQICISLKKIKSVLERIIKIFSSYKKQLFYNIIILLKLFL